MKRLIITNIFFDISSFFVSGDKGSVSSTTQSLVSGTPILSRRQNVSSVKYLNPIKKPDKTVNIYTLFRRIV